MAYTFAVFCLCACVAKGVCGILTGSQSLLVSGIPAIFGMIISIKLLLRMHASGTLQNPRIRISHGQMEYLLVAGISFLVAISTAALLLFVAHLALYHTLYPPDLMAGWVSILMAAANWVFAYRIQSDSLLPGQSSTHKLMHVLNADFVFSVLVALAVVVSRSGLPVLDYLLAIILAFITIPYSVYYLYKSFGGLMDASCNPKTLSAISTCIHEVNENISIEELRVTRSGKQLEIVSIIGLLVTVHRFFHEKAEMLR